MKNVKSMCQEGGFDLTKFASNSKRVLRSIPEKDRKFISIYDPLGFGAPFLLKGKQIIKKLCQLNLKWDKDIPDDISKQVVKMEGKFTQFRNGSSRQMLQIPWIWKSSRLQLTSFLPCLRKWLWPSKLHSPCR